MFYKKTDAEVFCETLLKLVEKQEKFVERHLGKAKVESPYTGSINVILTQIEHKFGLPSGKASSINKPAVTHDRLIDSPAIQTTQIQKVEKKKRGRPPKQRFFNGTKPPVQVVHGHSDDIVPHYHTEEVKEAPVIGASVKHARLDVEKIKPEAEAIKPTMTPPPSATNQNVTVTPENIDALAENLVGSTDSQNEVLPE